MLADHLDGALASGEDLVTYGGDWRALAENPGEIAEYVAAERKICEAVRSSELMLIARALKAREHARELALIDKRFGPVANLFVSATAILLDAVEECGDATEADFETGDGIIAYIRSRGLIAPDVANVMNPAQLTIDDSFLVAKRLALGPLLDMVAAFLDALEIHYDLFVAEEIDDKAAPAARTEFGRRERIPLN
jgi:hypothetical protein